MDIFERVLDVAAKEKEAIAVLHRYPNLDGVAEAIPHATGHYEGMMLAIDIIKTDFTIGLGEAQDAAPFIVAGRVGL